MKSNFVILEIFVVKIFCNEFVLSPFGLYRRNESIVVIEQNRLDRQYKNERVYLNSSEYKISIFSIHEQYL